MMKRDPRSTSSQRRMNARQRKKRRVGEFKELCFDVELVFRSPIDSEQWDRFADDLFDFLDRRHLTGGGFGGRFPLNETDGIITTYDRGSTTEEDREAVTQWLRERSEIAEVRALDFKDAWHGYNF